MKLLTRGMLRSLADEQNEIYISIFLPTGNTGADGKQSQIRLKNLLRQAQDQLIEYGYKKPGIEELTDSVQKLVDDTLFWSFQSSGIAIFLSEKGMCYYQVPLEVPELAVVSKQGFHLNSLLPLLTEDGQFYILSLNQKQVRLFACTKYICDELVLRDVPVDIGTYLMYDDPERQLQFTTHTPGGGGATRAASYHGHSVSDEDKDNLLRFFNEIDKGVRKTIGDDQIPIVIAGVEYYLPIYREANQYNGLISGGVVGSTEQMSIKELHKAALEIVEPIFVKKRLEAAQRYFKLEGTGKTFNDIEDIVKAAHEGRVDTMFVAAGAQQWGIYNDDTNEVHFESEARIENLDLINEAAMQAFFSGGNVFALPPDQVPGGQDAVAILRY